MNNNKVKDDINSTNKEIIAKLRKAQADFTEVGVRNALNDLLLTDAVVHMPYPFGDLVGPDDFFDTCYAPLFEAIKHLRLMLIGNNQSGAGGLSEIDPKMLQDVQKEG